MTQRLRFSLHSALAVLSLLGASIVHADSPPAPEEWPGQSNQLLAARAGHPLPGTAVLRAPDGKWAYLLSSPCCDHFNTLFDAKGQKICAPTGGLGGRGDGKCPAWVAAALTEARHEPSPAAPAASQ